MTLFILIGVGTALAIGTAFLLAKKGKKREPQIQTQSESNSVISVVTKESGLKIETLKSGSGTRAADRGDLISVHYTGWLTDGKKFDSSVDRGTPFEFKLGQGKVITGWEEGLRGMKIGEKRRLTVPAKIGYGSRGTARIPPRSTLIFEVELLGIR